MKNFKYALLLISALTMVKTLSPLTIKNTGEHDIRIRIYPAAEQYNFWKMGRLAGQVTGQAVKAFSEQDLQQLLERLRRTGKAWYDKSINYTLDRIANAQAVVKSQMMQQFLESNLGKRAVDMAFQLDTIRLKPGQYFKKDYPGKPTVFIVATAPGSKEALHTLQAAPGNSYDVKMNEVDPAAKNPVQRYKVVSTYQGSK